MTSRRWADSTFGWSAGATRMTGLRQGLERETNSCQLLLHPEKPCCCDRLGTQEAEDGENGHQKQEVSLDRSHGHQLSISS